MISSEFLKKAKLPIMLLAILVLPQFFGSYVPMEFKSCFYAISLSMKSILEFFLPFIIFSFIFSCLSNFQKGAVLFVVLLVCCVFISNMAALIYGYGAGKTGLSILNFNPAVINQTAELVPAWTFNIKKWATNDFALLCGFISGMFFSIVPSQKAKWFGDVLNKLANAFLRKLFIPLLPLFVLGFVFKLEYENTLHTCLKVYGPILLLIVSSQWLYILHGYLLSGKYSITKALKYLKNVFPATLTGFTTISSAASMPVLLLSTEKNLQNAEKANSIVPAIINIHTLGSAIAIPILALATIVNFNLPIPSFSVFLIFALYTALAKFAVAV